jgi:hypothetical protein
MTVLNHLNRRRILRGAGALGAAGALAALPALDAAHAEPARPAEGGPAGSWVAMVTILGTGAPPPFRALRTYSDGGGYIESASNSMNPQAPDSPGHGTWARTGGTIADSTRGGGAEPQTFAVTFIVDRFDGSGNLIGTIKVRESATLSQTGDTYTGRGAFEFLDLHGNVIASGTATATATRIKVEPLL